MADYQEICMLCHRSEDKAGKMIHLMNNICVCRDCLDRTMNAVNNLDMSRLGDDPMMFASMMKELFDTSVSNKGDNEGSSAADGPKPVNETPVTAADKDRDHEEEIRPSDDDGNEQETEGEKQEEEKPKGVPLGSIFSGIPNISFLNMSDLFGGAEPGRQRVKKPKEHKPIIRFEDIPAPHKIKEQLDEYVIGQEQAKKILSVAVYNHYKRVATDTMDSIEIEKSNVLMIGPTGSGKTYLVRTLARLLNVPLAITDATSLTEAGYIGDDIESVVSKLLAAAGNDVDRAEQGIIFIDEIDKIAKKHNHGSRDVNGESVQQGMLKLLEGAEVEVPVGASSKTAMVPMTTVNTRNILFICGGAFPDLDEIIKQRLRKKTSIGYGAELKDKFDKDKNILEKVTIEDLKKFGMIPEFIGRLPIICTLQGLTEEMLVRILKEPKNAILKQYEKLLELDEVKLCFDEGALEAIAAKAMEKDTGARALRAIIEELMLDIMYEIPKDDNIGHVTITGDYINGTGGPVIELRG